VQSTAAGSGSRTASASSTGRVRLTEGETFYRIDGPEHGTPLLLIHGATVPHWSFDGLVPYLTDAGFRTVRYDLYGHGESDRPRGRYDHQRFVRQALDFIEAMGIERGETRVWGYSMGAAIAASVAVELPCAAAPLILLAPLLDFSGDNPYRSVVRTPVAGELAMTLFGRRALIRRRQSRYTAIGRPDLIDRFLEQLQRPGYWRALLSMQRHDALGDQRDVYERAARAGLSPIIVHGSADAITPPAAVAEVASIFPGAHRIELDGLEHNLMLTHPGRVAGAMLAALEH
jgi:pimeloyl-ACP methyl ester carboxylesterase